MERYCKTCGTMLSHRESEYCLLHEPPAERSEVLQGCVPSATGSADARAADEAGADSLARSIMFRRRRTEGKRLTYKSPISTKV